MDADYKRLNRLTAILHQLQAKRLTTAPFLAEKFGVSVRTIYRDIRSLEQSGVPIISEEGKGYSLVDGYRLPPVSFTEKQALALITAEQLVQQTKDSSLIAEFNEAILKIKSVLSQSHKESAEAISERVFFGKNTAQHRSSSWLMDIQDALIKFKCIEVEYTRADGETSTRIIEPFVLYNNYSEDWVLVAVCQLRADFRTFRLDRIKKLKTLDQHFAPHKITIEQYLKRFVSPNKNP